MKNQDTHQILMGGNLALIIGLASVAAGLIKLIFPESVGYEINPYALFWFGVASISQHTISKLRVKLINAGTK